MVKRENKRDESKISSEVFIVLILLVSQCKLISTNNTWTYLQIGI
jgi:hypothetical protein